MKQKSMLCGMDEAGRGALAGPLVAAAVWTDKPDHIIMREFDHLPNDSKLLTPKTRNRIFHMILELHLNFEIIAVSNNDINDLGIAFCNRDIFRKLIHKIDSDQYIVDGNIRFGPEIKNVRSIPRADQSIPVVMLSSIIAKVYRDRIMTILDIHYPQYGWKTNKGYGTSNHILSITRFGISPYHRILYVNTALTNHQRKTRISVATAH